MGKNTIKLKKYLDIINEYSAAAAVTPGQVLELTSAGAVQAHSVAGGNAPKYIALENELEGGSIEDNYALADKVQVWYGVPGEEALLILADGENIAIGDLLESNGAGYVQKHVSDVESVELNESGVLPLQIIGQALEAKDLSDSSGAESSEGTPGYNKRIKVRIV